MSSRRARIKAVSSLPVRRKNNANTKRSCTPKPQDDTQIKSDGPIETPTKVHMEQASSSEHEKSDVTSGTTNGIGPEITATNNNLNISVQEQSKITKKPESNSTILANALTRPLNKTVENVATKTPIIVDPCSFLRRDTNDDSSSNTIKILSNVPISSVRWNSANEKTNEREKVIGRHGDKTVGVEGIVPLGRNRSGAVELFKSEIMSKSAEVMFDLILPLPSNHNLRSSSRLALPSPRRNTTQDSASDSEDEHRQVVTAVQTRQAADSAGTGRAPRDSQSSRGSQQAQPTVRSRSSVSSLRSEKSLRGHALNRDQLTLYDFIFHNPISNPIIENKDEEIVAKKMEESGVEVMAEEEESEEEGLEEREETMPAPQIKIGPDGQIVIDEKSLVINETKRVGVGGELSAHATCESESGGGCYSRLPRTKSWSDAETVRFYRALTAVGTDFSLMLTLFPDRSRREIKNKFKKEERQNGVQIDKALMAHVDFDVESLARQFARERREVVERARRVRREARDAVRVQRQKIKLARAHGLNYSKAARSMVEMMPIKKPSLKVETAEDILLFNSLHQSPKHKGSGKVADTVPSVAPRHAQSASTTQSCDLSADVDPLSVAKDAAPGSLICLTTPDPDDPSKMVLQIYVSDGSGGMKPITLPPAMLAYVKDCMSSRSPSMDSTQLTSTSATQQQPSPTAASINSSCTIINL